MIAIQGATYAQGSSNKYNPTGMQDISNENDPGQFHDQNKPNRKASPFADPFTGIGRWAWGNCRAVAMTGKYALVGQGYMYQVFDISDPSSPRMVYDSLMEDWVTDIKIKDSLLFILYNRSVLICSAKSLFPLMQIGRWNLNGVGLLKDMTLADSCLYLLADHYGMFSLNIADPANPQWFASYHLGNVFPNAIASSGKTVYYAPWGLPLVSLVLLQYVPDSIYWREQRLMLDYGTYSLHVEDTLLFVGGDGAMQIYDIADSWNISLIGSVNLGTRVEAIAIKGNDAYCATRDSGIVAVNIPCASKGGGAKFQMPLQGKTCHFRFSPGDFRRRQFWSFWYLKGGFHPAIIVLPIWRYDLPCRDTGKYCYPCRRGSRTMDSRHFRSGSSKTVNEYSINCQLC
ncbi:MAG: hypothetical protein ACHQQQ_12565 [Bacteroidota bacterium]